MIYHKDQGKKSTCTYDMSKLSSFVGKYINDSREKVRKYIRLTFLIPELLKIVDDTVRTSDKHKLTMGILPAVELSYLSIEEQKLVYSVITYEDRTPSHGQTKLIRKLSVEKNLNFDSVEKILTENKGNQREQISFNKDRRELPLTNSYITAGKSRLIEGLPRWGAKGFTWWLRRKSVCGPVRCRRDRSCRCP